MTPIERLLRDRIASDGPLPVAAFMEIALSHPEHGYYRRADPLGVAGDFITAPEISQVFGELIGLWAAVTWQQMGSPPRILLAECGPGRGTLMADALRAARSVPDFGEALEIHLVETSPVFREKQRDALPDANAEWHDRIEDLPPGPLILIANEFLDALPIRQFLRLPAGWAERCIDVIDDRFAFVAGPAVQEAETVVPENARDAAPGTIVETCPAAQNFSCTLAARIAEEGGAALLIDYGHAMSAAGDTLQAMRDHAFANPLTDIGEADLTAHVDFAALARAISDCGAVAHGPVTQRAFLTALGIHQRTAALALNATVDQAVAVAKAMNRLIDASDMGTLFKVLAVTAKDAPTPAAFEY